MYIVNGEHNIIGGIHSNSVQCCEISAKSFSPYNEMQIGVL